MTTKRNVSLGIGTLITGAAVAANIPRTPSEAITWVDFAMHFMQEAGMAGIILVLMAVIFGILYYYETKRIPKIHTYHDGIRGKWEIKEGKLEDDIKKLNGDALAYRDEVLDRLEKLIVDATTANLKLEGVLLDLVARIKELKKGKSNGST